MRTLTSCVIPVSHEVPKWLASSTLPDVCHALIIWGSLSGYCVPYIELGVLHVFLHLILTVILYKWCYHFSRFADVDTEARRDSYLSKTTL